MGHRAGIGNALPRGAGDGPSPCIFKHCGEGCGGECGFAPFAGRGIYLLSWVLKLLVQLLGHRLNLLLGVLLGVRKNQWGQTAFSMWWGGKGWGVVHHVIKPI